MKRKTIRKQKLFPRNIARQHLWVVELNNSNGWQATSTCEINQAEVFTEAEVLKIASPNHNLVAWPKDYIDEHISYHVDNERIDSRCSGVQR